MAGDPARPRSAPVRPSLESTHAAPTVDPGTPRQVIPRPARSRAGRPARWAELDDSGSPSDRPGTGAAAAVARRRLGGRVPRSAPPDGCSWRGAGGARRRCWCPSTSRTARPGSSSPCDRATCAPIATRWPSPAAGSMPARRPSPAPSGRRGRRSGSTRPPSRSSARSTTWPLRRPTPSSPRWWARSTAVPSLTANPGEVARIFDLALADLAGRRGVPRGMVVGARGPAARRRPGRRVPRLVLRGRRRDRSGGPRPGSWSTS